MASLILTLSTVCCALLINSCAANVKFWKFDTKITNPANWDPEADLSACHGIIFAPENTAEVFVDNLKTSQIVLPRDGEIDFGGVVDFTSDTKCIKLKPLNYQEWFNPNSWDSHDFNAATPDLEKIPCFGDTVIFPDPHEVSVFINQDPVIVVKEIKFSTHETVSSVNQMIRLLSPQNGLKIKSVNHIHVAFNRSPCLNHYGCHCHHERIYCPEPNENERAPVKKCLSPITPENFCSEICGAAITFRPKAGFQMDDLKKKLDDEYSSDSHVSRVQDELGNEFVQVVFSEKEYSGDSVTEAEQLYREFTESGEFIGENFVILKSGAFYEAGRSTKTALGLVFGTLVGVMFVFGVLFYLNGEQTNFDSVRNSFVTRFQRHRAGSLFTSPLFARFDNTDENLIIEGSTQNLNKSFDNPLYGKPSTSTDGPLPDSSSKSEHENPLYDVALRKADEETSQSPSSSDKEDIEE